MSTCSVKKLEIEDVIMTYNLNVVDQSSGTMDPIFLRLRKSEHARLTLQRPS